jgi:hypothetical protein
MLFLFGGLFQEFSAEYLRNPLRYPLRYFRYPSMVEQGDRLVISVAQRIVIHPEIVSDSPLCGKILERVPIGIHYTVKRVGPLLMRFSTRAAFRVASSVPMNSTNVSKPAALALTKSSVST